MRPNQTNSDSASQPEHSSVLPRLVDKPVLRGWLHLGMAPLALAAGIVLVALSPSVESRIASAVYATTATLLFTTSAIYHVGSWRPLALATLRRMDHCNIYLIIAGTYTPFVVLVLDGQLRTVLLWVIWGAALAGVGFKAGWVYAPRWLSTSLYLALGWVALLFFPQLIAGTHAATWILLLVGGGLYSLGGVIYAARWPNIVPRWFGFHEAFHALTIAAYVCQYIAVSFVTYGLE